MILQLGNQIEVLNEEIQIGKQSHIEDIVKVVVTMLDKPKDLEKASETSKEHQNIIHWDQYEFKCIKEKQMIKHISQIHEGCHSWDLCARYFGTKNLLQKHKIKTLSR